jgi:hypothetical protein
VGKLCPLLGTAVLLGAIGTVSAQVPVTFNTGAKAATTNFGAINMSTMLPNMNVNRALIAPNNTSRLFDFTRILPNFGFLNSRYPTQRAYSQIDQKYFYPYLQNKKK